MTRSILAFVGCVCALVIAAAAQSSGLRIRVVSGEDAVNIIQQKTAVAPVVEVRDRNDLPVAGASVVFLIGGKGARFAGNATKLQLATDASGRATASGIEAIGKGAVRIEVQASYQGETATATISQTNVATLADAAKVSKATTSSPSGSNGAAPGRSNAASGGGAHVGLIVGASAAAVGGVVAARSLGLIDGRPVCNAESDAMFAASDVHVQCVASGRSGGCAAEAQAVRTAIDRYCACEGQPSDSATGVSDGGFITGCSSPK
jgi:hypothetical protein